MTQRSKLELEVNESKTIELLYDEPVVGESQYGTYNLYAVRCGGREYSFFATDSVHEQLKNLRRGDKATITKLAVNRGNKVITTYAVEVLKEQVAAGDTQLTEESSENTDSTDSLYEIMLNSYEDALKIQAELNGLVDVSRVAITLFIARAKNGNYPKF